MILGTGVDLIEIGRIAAALKNPEFGRRVFSERELAETRSAAHRLSGYFAAKEALLKAMGTGLSGFSWQEMEVRHDSAGAPFFEVNGKVREYLDAAKMGRIHLSISHSREYAVAQVILEEVGE